MNTLQTSPYLSQFDPQSMAQNMKKSFKSVSKYIESSARLYSPKKVTNKETSQGLNPKDTISQQRHDNKSLQSTSENNIGRVVSRLQNRLQGAEVKIASLTNIVKLLQKYSETKDDQYEKEKENILFVKNYSEKVQQIQTLQIQNKIKEFNLMSKQMKKQLQQVTILKAKFQQYPNTTRNNISHAIKQNKSHNQNNHNLMSNKSKRSQFKSPSNSHQGSIFDLEDIAMAFQQMQQRLRQQINKKMQICLRQVKKIGSVTGNDISGVDQNLFEEQINSMNFAINKVENQCLRNRMLLEKQIEELAQRLGHKRNNQYMLYGNLEDAVRSTSRHSRRQKQQKAVRDNSRSLKRQKSRSRSLRKSDRSAQNKSKQNLKLSQVQQKKKIKEQQLREAIRKKKQTKQKLRARNF